MSIFTASNGVKLDSYGDLYQKEVTHISADVDAARKEFYQHRRDQETGQWRSRKDPDFTVRQEKPTEVLVTDEKTGRSKVFQAWHVTSTSGSEPFARAARRFLQRPIPKPEPKPWHNPQPGTVWEIQFENSLTPLRALGSDQKTFIFTDGEAMPADYPGIETAHQVFPQTPTNQCPCQ